MYVLKRVLSGRARSQPGRSNRQNATHRNTFFIMIIFTSLIFIQSVLVIREFRYRTSDDLFIYRLVHLQTLHYGYTKIFFLPCSASTETRTSNWTACYASGCISLYFTALFPDRVPYKPACCSFSWIACKLFQSFSQRTLCPAFIYVV